MDAATATDKAISKARGRKNSEGQEAIIYTTKAKNEIERLIKLKTKSEEAAEDFNNAVKHVAEQAGIQAGVLRKFVNARAGEKYEDEKRRCEQLALLFEEVGEA
jgi:hypothetical protein